jgi:hypothetical protein
MNAKSSITRPANTTAYASGDVINENASTSPIELVIGAPSGTWVLGGQLICSNPLATGITVDVMLFSKSFTIAADNAAFAPTDTEMKDYYLGTLTFDNFKALTNNAFCDGYPTRNTFLYSETNPFKIYAVIVIRSAYTPTSAEVWTLKLDVSNE